MIGIVIVSHSEKLAKGVKEVADQLNDGSVEIQDAGGLEGGIIGTNPLKIKEAIESLKNLEHILIFVDLGSAVISSEMAIELLDEGLQGKVRIVNAPIVEGVIAATVQASMTDNVQEIIKTAEDSREISKV